MQGEDIFLGQNYLGKIFILLNSLEKSGIREKEKKTCYAVARYTVTRYTVIGLLTTLTFVDVKFTSIVHV